MSRSIFCGLVMFFFSSSGFTQSCVTSILTTTNVKHYYRLTDGTIHNAFKQIVWAPCAIGQQWKKKQCIGKAKLVDWNQARKIADNFNTPISGKWRLPSVHELSSITELSCENPAINLQLFPNAPSMHFWTGVEFVNDTNKAWQVFFGTGENHTAKKTSKAAVRLVRSENKR